MSTAAVPVYFEQSWAILSTIGLVNVLYGSTVIGITSLSPISLTPLVVSVAGAIANGLCYYAFYGNYNTTPSLVAAVFADIMWLIQEAGLSFYSYLILTRVLMHKPRQIFMILFWSLIVVVSGLRIGIAVSRALNILSGTNTHQKLISHLHIGYFVTIALIEILSAFFLLQKFAKARKTSMEASSTSGLFRYLIRSTEVRLAMLALIGITRAITYSFQETAQSATNIAGQLDRFVYTLECLFPIMMFIDILASKLVVTNHVHSSANSYSNHHSKSDRSRPRKRARENNIALYSISQVETRIQGGTTGQFSSSQEHIVGKLDGEDQESTNSKEGKSGGINKTVEFELRESN